MSGVNLSGVRDVHVCGGVSVSGLHVCGVISVSGVHLCGGGTHSGKCPHRRYPHDMKTSYIYIYIYISYLDTCMEKCVVSVNLLMRFFY